LDKVVVGMSGRRGKEPEIADSQHANMVIEAKT
jgi:hypothetical protein